MESMHLQASLSLHCRRYCVWKGNGALKCLNTSLKENSAWFVVGMGMTNVCTDQCTAKHHPLLAESHNFQTHSCSSAISPKSHFALADSKPYGLCDRPASGCSLWTGLTCKSGKGSFICKVSEPLKQLSSELENSDMDHPRQPLLFGSKKAKQHWLLFKPWCLFISQSRI